MKKFMFTAMLLASSQAHAGFWTNDFTITNLYVAGGQNYHYRVYGMPAQSGCPQQNTMAYLNEDWSGAKGQMASILMAYSSGKVVRLFIEPDANGFCKILEIFISN